MIKLDKESKKIAKTLNAESIKNRVSNDLSRISSPKSEEKINVRKLLDIIKKIF